MGWTSRYLHYTYAEANCYDLLRIIYKEELGIEVPAPAKQVSAYTRDVDAAPIMESDWVQVPHEERREFDAVLFRGTEYLHCGVLVDRDNFINSRKAGVCVESLRDSYWKSRTIGIFRPRLKKD